MKILIFTHALSRHKDDHPQFINELAIAYQESGHVVRILTASHKSIRKELLDRRLDIKLYRYAPKIFEILGYGESMKHDLKITWLPIFISPLMFFFGYFSLKRG